MVRARCGLPDSSQPVREEEPMSGPGFTRPDLCSISAATEQTDSADAVSSLLSADGYPLASDYSLGPVTPNVAHALVEADFTLHHRDRYDPLYRLGRGQRTEAER
jgi:hypothetical protein